uniref:Uncharacterized protein n=1 Tax=Strongyloides stercoralis TaxID=6248 RepID=A0AAF5DKB4_STRER
MEKFSLTIHNKINCNEDLAWHREVKFVIHHNNATNECTNEMKLLFVSKKFVIINQISGLQGSNSISNQLLTYNKNHKFFNYPDCLQRNKLYYKFENDLYIDVDKEGFWTNEKINPKHFDNHVLNLFESKNLSVNAFILGVEVYLNINPHAIQLIGYHKEATLSNYYEAFTKLPLNDNEVNIQIGMQALKEANNKVASKIFKKLCEKKNENLKNLMHIHTPEEKVRAYLERNDVTYLGKNEFGEYIVEICKRTEGEVIYSNHQVGNICFNYLPVKTKNGKLMFSDNDNYLHHFSESKKCGEVVSEETFQNNFSYYEDKGDSFYEMFSNWIMKKLHLYDRTIKLGWWSFRLQKFKNVIIFFVVIICIILSIPTIYIGHKLGIFEAIFSICKWIHENVGEYYDIITDTLRCFNFKNLKKPEQVPLNEVNV